MKSLIFVLSVAILSLSFVAASLNVRLGLEALSQQSANAILMQYRIFNLERNLLKGAMEREMPPADNLKQ